MGKVYNNGQTWAPYGEKDPCFVCICEDGEFKCEKFICSDITCGPDSDPVFEDCCNQCGITYQAGAAAEVRYTCVSLCTVV